MAEATAATVALLAALFFSLSGVLMRKGLVETNVLSGFLVNIIASSVLFWALLPLYFRDISLEPIVIFLFVAGGLSGTILGRFLTHKGVKETGAPVAASISNLAPIVASGIGFAFLGEVPTVQKIVGIPLAAAGVAILSTSGAAAGWRRRALIFPALGGLFFGFGLVFRKTGLIVHNYPLFGGAVNTTAALAAFTFLLMASGSKKFLKLNRRTFTFFFLGGLSESTGVLLIFIALSIGSLSTVAPVAYSYPILTLPLAYIFLRVVEKITLRTVLGVLMTVLGVILVTTF